MRRNNVRVSGAADAPVVVFAHGFGCDQHMWRHVAPAFADQYRVVLFDHVGAGGSDLAAYDVERYSTLQGYADDIVEVIDALPARDVVFVGHSVAAMMGVLAAAARPDLFDRLVLVGPSARYIDDGEYVGGFTKADVDDLLDAMDSNYLGWSTVMAPVIAGNSDTPEYGRELTDSFCRTDPGIARRFAEVTFRSDNRADLPGVTTPTLVLQCSDDAIAPESAGQYVADHLPHSTFVHMQATGHTPNLTAPAETTRLIKDYLGS